MQPEEIKKAEFLDILFEGRNKEYGAYDLRKTYRKRLVRAMLLTGGVILLLFAASFLAKALPSDDDLEVADVEMAEVAKDEPPPPPPPPPPPTPPPPPEVNQIKFTPPVIVKDEEVKPDEKIEEIKEDQVISTQTVVSENTQQVVQAPVEEKASTIVETPAKPVEEDRLFTKVEIEAEYPGGPGAWTSYVRKNLNTSVPSDNNAPGGTYTVIVRFVVAKDDSISDVQAETSNGYGLEAEAVRVIKKGSNWKPGIQNGVQVKSVKRQPISFVVSDE